MRARLAVLAAAPILALVHAGCAQGRSPSDAAVGPRDAGQGVDATLVFPDAFVPDASGLPHDAAGVPDASVLDAGVLDAGVLDAGALDDARAPAIDAASRVDAWACPCTPGGACTTSCGTTGTRACAPGCVASCTPPAETCNAADDDCDGSCDEELATCRAGVVRAYHDTDGGHLYTRDRAEALALGFRIESEPFFFVYPSAQPGTSPFHRCFLGGAHRLYTFDAGCEGSGAAYEGVLGWVAMGPVCGARPLYRLSSRDNHFYTVDAAERDYAVSIGYLDEGVAAYVW
jgi:hypothetical protein